MEKLLLVSSPEVSGYPIHANVSSILSGHSSYRGWLYTNYMQLRFDLYDNDYFLDYYQPLMREYHPLLNIHSVQKELLRLMKINITEFFVESLNNGNYVYVLINKQAIDLYKTSKSAHHDLFIYGYNLSQKVFHVADFFPNPFPTYQRSM